MTRRRGYSLIEMIVVMIAITLVMGLGAATLQGVLTMEGRARREAAELADLERVANAFRDRAHAAQGHRAVPEGATEGLEGLVLTFEDGGTLEYRVKDERLLIVREVIGAGTRTERARLPKGSRPSLALVRVDGAWLAVLIVEDARAPDRAWRIEAALGRIGGTP